MHIHIDACIYRYIHRADRSITSYANENEKKMTIRPMRFWELVSAFGRTQPDIILDVLKTEQWCDRYLKNYETYSDVVKRQDRNVLDAPVPVELSREIATRFAVTYEINGNILRETTSTTTSNAKKLTALEVHDYFGGATIEEIGEFGSAVVSINQA